MRPNLLPALGEALKAARRRRGLTQPMLATRLGRSPSRISEFETDLLRGRLGKDRLTLLVELCDALDLVPMLIPRDQVHLISQADAKPPVASGGVRPSTFDEVFIDLSEDTEDDPHG